MYDIAMLDIDFLNAGSSGRNEEVARARFSLIVLVFTGAVFAHCVFAH